MWPFLPKSCLDRLYRTAIVICLWLLVACGDNGVTPPSVQSVPISSPSGMATTGVSTSGTSAGAVTTGPASTARVSADVTSLKIGDTVTLTGEPGQNPVMNYTLLLDGQEFARDDATLKDVKNTNPVFEFVSASRRGNGAQFVLKAVQPGKVTVSLKASGEISYSSGGKPVSVLFNTLSNSTELTVVS